MPTDHRSKRMQTIAAQRTEKITLLLDDVHDPHNVAAILRSADAFGLRDVHAVECQGRIRISNRVARGTHHWVNLFRYPSRLAAVKQLKNLGYAIWVAAAGDDAVMLESWNPGQPTAFVFGNEHAGVNSEIQNQADRIFQIPMVGMVESLNVSVATAVTLQSARRRLEQSNQPYVLNEVQQKSLIDQWSHPREKEL